LNSDATAQLMIHTIEPLSRASRLNVKLPASFCKVRIVVLDMLSLFFYSAFVLLDFLFLEAQGKVLFIRCSRIFLRFIVIFDDVKKKKKTRTIVFNAFAMA